MEFYRSERYKSLSSFIRKRKALSDLTNAPSLLKSDPKRLEPKRSRTSSYDFSSGARCSRGSGSSGAENRRDRVIPASESQAEEISSSSSVTNAAELQKSKHSRIAMQKRTEGEVTALARVSNCPPVTRTSVRGRLDMQHEDSALPATSSVPRQKARKKNSYKVPAEEAYELPTEFIERQKAYFAEIDAFELPEEEVSESEMEQ